MVPPTTLSGGSRSVTSCMPSGTCTAPGATRSRADSRLLRVLAGFQCNGHDPAAVLSRAVSAPDGLRGAWDGPEFGQRNQAEHLRTGRNRLFCDDDVDRVRANCARRSAFET